jgi:hypothetical protein
MPLLYSVGLRCALKIKDSLYAAALHTGYLTRRSTRIETSDHANRG